MTEQKHKPVAQPTLKSGAALQRMQQALAKAEHEVEQLHSQAADIHVTDFIKDSHKDADTDNNTNGLDSHDSQIPKKHLFYN